MGLRTFFSTLFLIQASHSLPIRGSLAAWGTSLGIELNTKLAQ